MNRACGATAALMMGLMSHTVAAECVGIAGAMLKEMRAADCVFDGMVMRIDSVGADGTRTRVNHLPREARRLVDRMRHDGCQY